MNAMRKRLSRCGNCQACKNPDCGICINCTKMKKFGGPGNMRQCCVDRRCSMLAHLRAMRKLNQDNGTQIFGIPSVEETVAASAVQPVGVSSSNIPSEDEAPETQIDAQVSAATVVVPTGATRRGIPNEGSENERTNPDSGGLEQSNALQFGFDSPYEKENNLEDALPLFERLDAFLEMEHAGNGNYDQKKREQLKAYREKIEWTGLVFRDCWLHARDDFANLGIMDPPYLLFLCLNSDRFAPASKPSLKNICETFTLEETSRRAIKEWNLEDYCPMIVSGESNLLVNANVMKCIICVARVFYATLVLSDKPAPWILEEMARVLQRAEAVVVEQESKRRFQTSSQEQPRKKSRLERASKNSRKTGICQRQSSADLARVKVLVPPINRVVLRPTPPQATDPVFETEPLDTIVGPRTLPVVGCASVATTFSSFYSNLKQLLAEEDDSHKVVIAAENQRHRKISNKIKEIMDIVKKLEEAGSKDRSFE